MPKPDDELDLQAFLAEIISHPSTPPELATCAREIAAADDRFSLWFLNTVKPAASDDQLTEILEVFDRDYWQVAGACKDYAASGYRDPERLCQELSSMSARWDQTVEETTFPPSQKE